MNNEQNTPQSGQQWAGQPPQDGQYQPQQQWPQQQWAPQQQPPKKSWFARHKILTTLGALVLVIGGVSAANGSGGAEDPAAASTGQPADAKAAAGDGAAQETAGEAAPAEQKTEKKDGAPGVGSPVRDGKFEFTVTKVVTGKKSVGGEYLSEKAQGSYTLVYVTVKNIGDEPQTMFSDNQKVQDASGKSYSSDTEAGIVIQDNEAWMQEINPGNALKGVIVFDMPAGAKATELELHDSALSGGVTVDLTKG